MCVCVYVLYLLVHCLELKWYWLKRAHYCAYLKNWIHSLLQHTVLLVSCEHIKKKWPSENFVSEAEAGGRKELKERYKRSLSRSIALFIFPLCFAYAKFQSIIVLSANDGNKVTKQLDCVTDHIFLLAGKQSSYCCCCAHFVTEVFYWTSFAQKRKTNTFICSYPFFSINWPRLK